MSVLGARGIHWGERGERGITHSTHTPSLSLLVWLKEFGSQASGAAVGVGVGVVSTACVGPSGTADVCPRGWALKGGDRRA